VDLFLIKTFFFDLSRNRNLKKIIIMSEHQKRPLQIITYLVPGLNVELFETLAQYLESSLGKETTLVYESRFIGPQPDRIDPFKNKTADLGINFLCLHHTALVGDD
jgi:hypothetical protein